LQELLVYTDTGSNTTAHNMANNALPEPPIDTPAGASEMGMDARYVPYDSPSIGMTDGDVVGVSSLTADVGSYTHGSQVFRESNNLNTSKVDLSGLSKGAYIVKVKIKDTVDMFKIIKQ
jgi:hypothetical protein